jgi:hypothetical protein
MTLEPQNVAWQKKLLDTLKIGGVWGVPRNGMMVRKTGANSVEITRPADDVEDEIVIRTHIEAAGYKIAACFDPSFN